MYRRTLAAMAAALLACASVSAQPLTLQEAVRLAEQANPTVRARQAQLLGAESLQREVNAPLFNNPSLSLEGTRRSITSEGRVTEWNFGVAQPFETGGQQVNRRLAAAASLDAALAEIDEARRLARTEAASRFVAVLAAQRRVEVERRAFDSFDRAAQIVAKRRQAGEDTRLDANVAVVEAERARNALATAREQLLETRAELANALQWPADSLPEVSDDLQTYTEQQQPHRLEEFLAAARALPRHRALAARVEAARARVQVERGNRNPDVTVGLNIGREGFHDVRERLTTLSVSIPLPLFKRNEAAIGQALAEFTQAEVEQSAATREVQAQVRRLWARAESQRERVRRLQQALLPPAVDNQQLALKSRQAGQIGVMDELLINRQALEAERELSDALAELRATVVEMEYAVGWAQEGKAK